MLYYIFSFIVMPLYWLFRRPRVIGADNLASIKKGKAIVICNHRSMRDPVFIACTVPRYVHFMAKSELFNTRIGQIFFKMLLVFPVERKTADMQSMKQAIQILNAGKVFGVFPEGKRAVTDDVDAFEKGAAFFAIKAKALILPLYIPKNNFRILRRPRMYVGAAIMPEEYDFGGSKSAAVNKLTKLMEQRVDELRVQAGD